MRLVLFPQKPGNNGVLLNLSVIRASSAHHAMCVASKGAVTLQLLSGRSLSLNAGTKK